MSLSNYHKKRKFNQTPEPKGRAAKVGKQLHFVVQKHDATQLHYDFRLEAEGVLKSWAVPKGPSMDTADKRLAMMVEDHPFDYRTFEGIIPEGNYGAGTVMVWDEGNYLALGAKTAAESDKLIRSGIRKGELKFILNGGKLKGGFAMVKTKFGGHGNSWLLFKERDQYATNSDITKKDKSAISGRTLKQIEKAKDKVWPPRKRDEPRPKGEKSNKKR
ncbi:MAG TPA: DNA polymerase ligase N-terminal domain-containing protein [Patescibacteria group bacterium]|nr:DNA polymerase ligase N-terminal domain-containing protein [Patescibacteria group bacterium]